MVFILHMRENVNYLPAEVSHFSRAFREYGHTHCCYQGEFLNGGFQNPKYRYLNNIFFSRSILYYVVVDKPPVGKMKHDALESLSSLHIHYWWIRASSEGISVAKLFILMITHFLCNLVVLLVPMTYMWISRCLKQIVKKLKDFDFKWLWLKWKLFRNWMIWLPLAQCITNF